MDALNAVIKEAVVAAVEGVYEQAAADIFQDMHAYVEFDPRHENGLSVVIDLPVVEEAIEHNGGGYFKLSIPFENYSFFKYNENTSSAADRAIAHINKVIAAAIRA